MNYNNLSLFAFLICIFCLCQIDVDATICKPLSPFKIDCDDCRCSESGREYTCYKGSCGKAPFENDIAYIPRRTHEEKKEAEFPFMEDTVPINNEDEFDQLGDNSLEILDDNGLFEINKKGNLEDVGLEQQDATDFDSEIPDNYRYKRGLKRLRLISK